LLLLLLLLSSLTDEDNQESQEGASSSDPMDSLYRDVLRKERKPPAAAAAAAAALGDPSRGSLASDQSQDSPTDDNQSGEASDRRPRRESVSQRPLARAGPPPPAAPTHVGISRPIGSLRGAGGATSGGPLTVRGEIETISDGDIRKNREPEEGIRSIPRFRNYQQGNPSKVYQEW